MLVDPTKTLKGKGGPDAAEWRGMVVPGLSQIPFPFLPIFIPISITLLQRGLIGNVLQF